MRSSQLFSLKKINSSCVTKLGQDASADMLAEDDESKHAECALGDDQSDDEEDYLDKRMPGLLCSNLCCTQVALMSPCCCRES